MISHVQNMWQHIFSSLNLIKISNILALAKFKYARGAKVRANSYLLCCGLKQKREDNLLVQKDLS